MLEPKEAEHDKKRVDGGYGRSEEKRGNLEGKHEDMETETEWTRRKRIEYQ